MIIHINQARFLPALNYFHRMVLADVFIIRDDVQYQPKCWENRNTIKTCTGTMWLTVPMRNAPVGTHIKHARISDGSDWGKKIAKSIAVNYKKARYFDHHYPEIASFLLDEHEYLFDLNMLLINHFIRLFDIETQIVLASSLRCSGDTDGILIEMCKKIGGSVYLSGAEGRNYNLPGNWREAGLRLRYHDYTYTPYAQLWGGFIPWMCVLDLLFNLGRGGARDYLHRDADMEIMRLQNT